jgi:hypothetical protein
MTMSPSTDPPPAARPYAIGDRVQVIATPAVVKYCPYLIGVTGRVRFVYDHGNISIVPDAPIPWPHQRTAGHYTMCPTQVVPFHDDDDNRPLDTHDDAGNDAGNDA